MAELKDGTKKWAEERKAILDKVDSILEEITDSQGGEIHISLEIGCISTIDYSIKSLYVIPRGSNDKDNYSA